MGFTYDLARIRWLVLRGLHWPQVLPECLRLRSHVSGPIIFILHAGGNDVGYTHSVDLISTIKRDIAHCYAVYTNLVLIWSEIVPRLLWARKIPGPRLECFRRKVNAKVTKFVRQIGGFVF